MAAQHPYMRGRSENAPALTAFPLCGWQSSICSCSYCSRQKAGSRATAHYAARWSSTLARRSCMEQVIGRLQAAEPSQPVQAHLSHGVQVVQIHLQVLLIQHGEGALQPRRTAALAIRWTDACSRGPGISTLKHPPLACKETPDPCPRPKMCQCSLYLHASISSFQDPLLCHPELGHSAWQDLCSCWQGADWLQTAGAAVWAPGAL